MIEIYSKEGCLNCVELINYLSTQKKTCGAVVIYKLDQHFKKEDFSSSQINSYPIIRWDGVLYSYGTFMKCYLKKTLVNNINETSFLY